MTGQSRSYVQDELLWGAAWLFKATKEPNYWNYVAENMHKLENYFVIGSCAEFGWDSKHAGINVLVSEVIS